ncbi:hypothetical protein BO70DRAFT_286256 [Aspergillus heteromorphus CBS 117.55]|uniref:Glutamine repeat protein-1 n=1 Tax=Aspergillus heteromorphus CBS 117.55 TaxID=1448321 RepID=A0A317WSZ8_9EURO|nr:uncharacterized protein BO70DRAFT_286256 [Aspergillus heteromorphus CBS 117.55]PWY88317.1 hypothetical protein BO70DRAFT_286256 [Aspergillus heteromorphus CBS 117.55]
MDPNVPGFPPAMQQTAGFPVTSQSSQQFPYYPNAIPSFPQPKPASHPPPQQQQHSSFGAVPLQAGPGGAMMPSGFPQHSSAGPHANFSAPFAQPPVAPSMNQYLPPQATSTPSLPATTAQSFPPAMAAMSANNMIPMQQQRPVPQPNPMQNAAQATAQSPATTAREKARVSALLEVNSILLQEVMNLQAAGKAGGTPAQQGGQESNPSPGSDQTPDKSAQRSEYVECMRRLQANLAYLANVADRAKKSGGVPQAAPAIMTPPPNMPSMNEVYNKLNELFPRMAPSNVGTPQPSPQASQGNGRPSPSPVAESIV